MAIKSLDHVSSVRVGNFVLIEVTPYFGSSKTYYKYSDVDFTHTINVTDFGNDQYGAPITSFTWTKTPQIQSARGRLVNITPAQSEIRGNTSPLTMTLTGLPDTDLQDDLLDTRFKWANVTIWRGLFDETGSLILESDLVTPLAETMRFKGYVSNYSVVESYDHQTLDSDVYVTVECSSALNLLTQKTAGRMTNSESNKSFFPTDKGMDRVTTIANTDFVFGFPKEKTT
jgi:hypothetical protein